MKLKSILKKASYKIVNPTTLELAQIAEMNDINAFAEATIKNANVGEGIMSALSNPAVAAGLGGLAAGGATYLTSQKKEDEDEKDYAKRRIMDSITNSLAGAAVGGATPVALNAIGNIAVPKEKGFFDKVKGPLFVNGILGGSGAAGGLALDKFVLHSNKAVDETRKLIDGSYETVKDVVGYTEDKKPIYGEVKKIIEGREGELENLLHKQTRHSKVRIPFLKLKGKIIDSILKGKLRNPAIGAGLALTVPLISKKIDQALSS